jgi:cyclophilin family peptidyl-prolyl cis-trans isomerase
MPSADKRARQKENARAAREAREAALKRKKRNRSFMTYGIVGVVAVGLIFILTITGGKKKDNKKATSTTTTVVKTQAITKLDPAKTYTATIATNLGTIKVKLDAKDAPIGAGRFVYLAKKGDYNGSRWHRIIKDFVIQGGAPGGDPTKDVGNSVVAEVPKGKYKLGDIAAAKTDADPNGTYDSQFFIVTGSQGEALPAQYADFGSVSSGMDVVKKIEALPTDATTQEPTQKATIDKVTITES